MALSLDAAATIFKVRLAGLQLNGGRRPRQHALGADLLAGLCDRYDQAVSGYRHSLATLARWCRIRSYLDSAAHGIIALNAIRAAIEGRPWLPPLPP